MNSKFVSRLKSFCLAAVFTVMVTVTAHAVMYSFRHVGILPSDITAQRFELLTMHLILAFVGFAYLVFWISTHGQQSHCISSAKVIALVPLLAGALFLYSDGYNEGVFLFLVYCSFVLVLRSKKSAGV